MPDLGDFLTGFLFEIKTNKIPGIEVEGKHRLHCTGKRIDGLAVQLPSLRFGFFNVKKLSEISISILP